MSENIKKGKVLDILKTEHMQASGLSNLVLNNMRSSAKEAVYSYEASKPGHSVSGAYIRPSENAIDEFISKNKNAHKVFNNSTSEPISERDFAVTALLSKPKNAASGKITLNNSDPTDVNSAIGPRSIVIPTLMQPTDLGLGKYVDYDLSGNPIEKEITVDTYLKPHSFLNMIRPDINLENIVVSDFSYEGGRGERQSAVMPTIRTDNTESVQIGATGTVTCNLFAQSFYTETTRFEQDRFEKNMFYNMFNLQDFKMKRTMLEMERRMAVDQICGTVNSFAKQSGEVPSVGDFSDIFTDPTSTRMLCDLSTAAFNSFIDRVQTLKNNADKVIGTRNAYRLLVIAGYDYHGLASIKDLNDSGNSFADALLNNSYGFIRLRKLKAKMAEVGIEVVPAPFFDPASNAGNFALSGKNPYGEKPIIMLTAQNNEREQLHHVWARPVPSSIGGLINYLTLDGMKQVTCGLQVYSEVKVVNPASGQYSRLLITTPNA